VRAEEHPTFLPSFKEKMVSTIQSEVDRLKRNSMKTAFKRRPKSSYRTKSLAHSDPVDQQQFRRGKSAKKHARIRGVANNLVGGR
jgi:hypothetical protein